MSVKIWSYGNYSSGNYGINAMAVSVKNLTIYFSYRTPIAFSHPSMGSMVRQNAWGPTTGKHLNWIDDGDKKSRVSSSQFEEELDRVINNLNVELPKVS